MKTAKELHAIAWEVKMKQLEEEKEKALNIVETEIFPKMEEAALNGEVLIKYEVKFGYFCCTIIDALEKKGYSTHKKGNVIEISWARG